MAVTREAEKAVNRNWMKKDYWIIGLTLAVTLCLCILVVQYWEYVRNFEQYGYLGLFIISVLAGSTALVPVPGVLVVFTLGAVMKYPVLVGAVAGLGEAVGAISIYMLGYGGRSFFKDINNSTYLRIVDWVQRKGSLGVFVMSAVVNPLFYPLTVAVAMMKLHLWKFFLNCWAGKTVKDIALAYAGYFGIWAVLRLLGIGI